MSNLGEELKKKKEMIDKYFVNQSYKIYFCHRKEQRVINLFSALRACFMELVYVSIFKRTPMAK